MVDKKVNRGGCISLYHEGEISERWKISKRAIEHKYGDLKANTFPKKKENIEFQNVTHLKNVNKMAMYKF